MRAWTRVTALLMALLVAIPVGITAAAAQAPITGEGEENDVVAEAMTQRPLLVRVTREDGSSYLSTDLNVTTGEGETATVLTVGLDTATDPEARLCTPMGLRFVTALSQADYEALCAESGVASIRIGTVILPTALLTGDDPTDAATYLDVEATAGTWYRTDEESGRLFFAGSIVDIKPQHVNTAFSGVGYVEVTLTDGSVARAYGAAAEAIPSRSIATASVLGLRKHGLNESEVYHLGLFAEQLSEEAQEALYQSDLGGLNVLAVGDELFAGHGETVGARVWVSLLAERYGWNLTNLGVSGATLSYDPDRTATNPSLYQLLINDPTYAFGSSEYHNDGTPSGDPRDVDLILLTGGVNDYDASVQALRGNYGDGKSESYLGAWLLITEELLDRYPNATVVFLTAWEGLDQERADNARAKAYTSAVNTLYQRVYEGNARVRIIDAGDPDVSGIDMVLSGTRPNEAFLEQYAYDVVNLNDAGMELMADRMLPLLWEIAVDVFYTEKSKEEQMYMDMQGLNVLAMGDSLYHGSHTTVGDAVWVNRLGKLCGWNLTNLGVGGATISYDPDREATNFSMYNNLFNFPDTYCYGSTANTNFYNVGNTKRDPEDVDLILLQAGSNDYGSKVQAPLGTVDSTDPATFLGAWRLMVDELLVRYPNATVIMLTAWENNNQNREDGANAVEFTSSVKDLYEAAYAENSRVFFIDSGDPDVSGVNMRDMTFRGTYAYDAFHLNDRGMELMANNMLPLLYDVACRAGLIGD